MADVADANPADGTQAQLYACNGTGAQVWQLTATNQLKNQESGECLSATGGANSTPLQIKPCLNKRTGSSSRKCGNCRQSRHGS